VYRRKSDGDVTAMPAGVDKKVCRCCFTVKEDEGISTDRGRDDDDCDGDAKIFPEG